MDLWIRSQDKKSLIPIEHGLYVSRDKPGVHCIYHSHGLDNQYCRDLLGIYDTEKRALEVLDDINDLLNTDINMNTDYQHADIIIKSCIASNMYKLYQMPEE